MISIVGYHTCKLDGGWSFIRSEAPFLSEDDPRQWLTQGYYFWTDSEYYAHRWGVDSYQDSYAIVKCKIDIDDHLLLDLVGKVSHQEYHNELMGLYQNRIKRAKERKGQRNPKVSVQDIVKNVRIDAAQGLIHFPYLAIKAQDKSGRKTYPFLDGGVDVMPARTRQQLCVFPEGAGCIVEKETVHPEDFAARSTRVVCS